jgi:hypothetical protein
MYQHVKPDRPDRDLGGGSGSSTAANGSTPADQPDQAGAAPAVFQFDPKSLVRAIAFHLVDEGIAADVSGDSVRRTIERLASRKISPSIQRGQWATMSNRQRMDWLLSESKTAMSVVFGKTAVLTQAK